MLTDNRQGKASMNPFSDAKILIDQILEARSVRLKALQTSAPDIERIERLESRCVELSDELNSVIDAAAATGWGIGDDVAEAMVRLEAALGQLATEEQRAAGWKAWENYRQAAVAGGLDSMVMLKTINQRDGLAIVTGGAAVDQGGDAPHGGRAQGTSRRARKQSNLKDYIRQSEAIEEYISICNEYASKACPGMPYDTKTERKAAQDAVGQRIKRNWKLENMGTKIGVKGVWYRRVEVEKRLEDLKNELLDACDRVKLNRQNA